MEADFVTNDMLTLTQDAFYANDNVSSSLSSAQFRPYEMPLKPSLALIFVAALIISCQLIIILISLMVYVSPEPNTQYFLINRMMQLLKGKDVEYVWIWLLTGDFWIAVSTGIYFLKKDFTYLFSFFSFNCHLLDLVGSVVPICFIDSALRLICKNNRTVIRPSYLSGTMDMGDVG